MIVTPHDPTDGIYPTTNEYIHANEVVGASRLLFIAGTLGLNARREPGATIDEQLELIWSNIRRILADAGMTVDNIVRLTSYLADPSYAAKNGAARMAALGGRQIPTTGLVVQLFDPRWLVEIEVIAAA